MVSALADVPTDRSTHYANFTITATITEEGMAVRTPSPPPQLFTSAANLLVHSDLQTIPNTIDRHYAANLSGTGYGSAVHINIPEGLTGATVLPGNVYISGGLFLAGLSGGAVSITENGVDPQNLNFSLDLNSLDIVLRPITGERSSPDTLTVRIQDSSTPPATTQQTYTIIWTEERVTFPHPYTYIADSTCNANDTRIVVDTGPMVSALGRVYAFPVMFASVDFSSSSPPVCDCSGISGGSATVTPPAGGTAGMGIVTLRLGESYYQLLDKALWYEIMLTTTYNATVPFNATLTVAKNAGLVLKTAEGPAVSRVPIHVKAVDGSVLFQSEVVRDIKVTLREYGSDPTHLTNFIPNDLTTDVSVLDGTSHHFYDFSPANATNKGVAAGGTGGSVLRTYEAAVACLSGGLFAFPPDAAHTYQLSILPELLGNSSLSTWSALHQAGLTAGPQFLGFYSRNAGFIGNTLTVTGTSYVNAAGATGFASDIVAIGTTGPSTINWQQTDTAKFCIVVMSGIEAVDGTGNADTTSSPILIRSDVYSVWLWDASAVSNATIQNAGGTGGNASYLAYEFPDCLRLDLLALTFSDPHASDAASAAKRYIYTLQCAVAGDSDPLPSTIVWYDISSNVNWSADGSTYVDYTSVGASWDDLRRALLGGSTGSGLPERNVTQLQDRDYGADKANCLVYRLLLQTQPRFDPTLPNMNLVASNLYRVATSQFRAFYSPPSNLTTSDQYKDYRMPNRVPFYRQSILDDGSFDATVYTSTAVWTRGSYDGTTGVRRSAGSIELLSFITNVPGLL